MVVLVVLVVAVEEDEEEDKKEVGAEERFTSSFSAQRWPPMPE